MKKLTEKHKKKLRLGYEKHLKATRKKVSITHKGKPLSDAHKNKIGMAHRKGSDFNCLVCDEVFWRCPAEIKKGQNKFCSKACYFEWQRGRARSKQFKENCRKGQIKRNKGLIKITPINTRIRNSDAFKVWRKAVFKRDNWTCQKCGARSKKGNYVRIEAHHLKPFARFPELRFIITNGLTLCKPCHVKEPKGKDIWNIQ